MNNLARFKSVRCFAFDIDGVMTDGTLLVPEKGEPVRKMHIRDGYALQWAVRQGYDIVVISGGRSEAAARRLAGLGIKRVMLGITDKREALEDYLTEKGLSAAATLYMGDDLPDLEALQLAGVRTCPSDAVAEIKAACHYVSPCPGGAGCVRDVIEKVLRLNDRWAV